MIKKQILEIYFTCCNLLIKLQIAKYADIYKEKERSS